MSISDPNKEGPIRILIVDDHAVVRQGLRALIATEPNMELVGEAADGLEAVRQALALRPDVILMDLVMPNRDGIEAIREIKQNDATARILVLTSFADDEKVFPAIKAGAIGYLLKDSSPQDLLKAIHSVYQGEVSLDPAVARKLVREISQPSKSPPVRDPLTERELEVLTLVARGLSNRDIAERLVISERTVRGHVSHILDKLHLASRTQATLYALNKGIATLNED